MTDIKTIIIANNLLAKESPASTIELDLLDELSKNGVCVDAFCSSRGRLRNKSANYNTIVVKELGWYRYVFRLIRFVIPDLCYLPDYQYLSWGRKVRKAIRKKIAIEKPDYIHSFSFACSCHLVAYKLHKEFGIPWIATFFDSWSDYPARKFKTKFFRRIDQKLERMVAENATVIVHDNEGIAKLWAERYGEETAKKIVVIPLNVNFSNIKKNVSNSNNKQQLNLSHIGSFYPQRDASAFIDAIYRFTITYPQLRNRIRVNFVGKSLDKDRKRITDLGMTDLFNITGQISAEECKHYYDLSDVFFATAGMEFEKISFPSKILKYFFYEKPILGLTPHGTVLETELKNAGHRCYEPNDVEGIVSYIYNAINDYSCICDFNKEYWQRFTVDSVADQYLNAINNYIKKL